MTEKEYRDALLRFFANPQNDKRDCMIFSELIREYFKLVEKETPKKDSVQCSATTVFAEEVWEECQI